MPDNLAAVPGDPPLQDAQHGSVHIFDQKAKRKQWVAIRCRLALGLLRRLVRRRALALLLQLRRYSCDAVDARGERPVLYAANRGRMRKYCQVGQETLAQEVSTAVSL